MAISSNSSTWMLPVLLLSLSISFHHSSSESSKRTTSSAKICSMNEFNNVVRHLEGVLKNCSEDCRLVPFPNKTCQCFNLSVPHENRGLSSYFIRGLNSLHLNSPHLQSDRAQKSREALKKILNRNSRYYEEMIHIGTLKIKNETIISPKSFLNTLELLSKLIKAVCLTPSWDQ